MINRYWLILLGLIPAIGFLFSPGFFASSDGMIHLYRVIELDRALHAGILFPRWFPLSGYGYGLPVLNYYPPLMYYVAEVFHLLGAEFIESIKLTIAVGFIVAALAMYIFARDYLSTRAAMVAGIAYAYLPYLLSDAYVRGNVPELLAMSFLPLGLWIFRRIYYAQRFDAQIVLGGFAFALVVLTHHLTAMLFAGLLGAYLFFLFISKPDARALLRCVSAVLLALALSAFYALPALGELDLVYAGPASVARFIVSRLTTLDEFLAFDLAYAYLPQIQVLRHAVGFPQTMAALASIIILVLMRKSKMLFAVGVFFWLATVGAILMTLNISEPLWYAIAPLRFLQFPWRFEIIAGIGIAFLIGVWIEWLASTFRRSASVLAPVVSLFLILLATWNLPVRAFPLADAQVNLLQSTDADYVIAQAGWGWTREFVPATVQEYESIYAPVAKPALSPAIDAPALEIQHDTLYSTMMTITTTQTFELSMHTFYFPGWRAIIDSANAETYPRGNLGLLTTRVPPGTHRVEFRFEDTPLRTFSTAISLLAVLAIAVWLIATRRLAPLFIAGLGLAPIAMILFSSWHLGPPAVPQSPAILNQRAMLVGYQTEQAEDLLSVKLYWLALQEMPDNYTSYVHLSDNSIVSQHDGPPDQGLTPTTRWLPGEIVVDRHILSKSKVKPGDYRLNAGMYLATDTAVSDLGQPIDLGTIQIQK